MPPTLLTPGFLIRYGQLVPGVVPMDELMRWIRSRMREYSSFAVKSLADRVIILKGKTASGKSTALPVYLLRLLKGDKTVEYEGPGVMSAQPKVITSREIAKDVGYSPHYPDIQFGVNIGYQTGSINVMPRGGIVVATIGTLLSQLRHFRPEDVFGLYRFIVIDEVHERSIEVDTTLMLLKRLMQENINSPSLPFVIITSATMDPNFYADYFGVGEDNIFIVEGRTYGVEKHWLAVSTNDFVAKAVETALEIHGKSEDDPNRGDIIIFLPGEKALKDAAKRLVEQNEKLAAGDKPAFLPVVINRDAVETNSEGYRTLGDDVATLAFRAGEKKYPVTRRIIMATNVAETGLTINSVGHVIDGGWGKVPISFPPMSVISPRPIEQPVSQAQAEQRAGRSGRLFPGHCYPMYTADTFAALKETQPSSMVLKGCESMIYEVILGNRADKDVSARLVRRRGDAIDAAASDLYADAAFSVTCLEPADVVNVGTIEKPSPDDVAMVVEKLVTYGYIDPKTMIPLRLFDVASIAGLKIETVRLVLSGYAWDVSLRDLTTMAAIVETTEFELRRRAPLIGQGDDHIAKLLNIGEKDVAEFKNGIGDDFVLMAILVEGFAQAVDRSNFDYAAVEGWCAANKIELPKMLDFVGRRDELMEKLASIGLNFFDNDNDTLRSPPDVETLASYISRIKLCLYESLRLNVCTLDPVEMVYKNRFGVEVKPTRTIARLMPRRFVTDSFQLVGIPVDKGEKKKFVISAGAISALDWGRGIPGSFRVQYDMFFLQPKPSA